MSKHNVTSAAMKRIEERIDNTLIAIKESGGLHDHPDNTGLKLLLKAVEPENFSDPRKSAVAVMSSWLRNVDEMPIPARRAYIISEYIRKSERERNELREAGSSLMDGIRRFGKLGL